MRVGGDVYVRAAYGTGSGWYGVARANGRAHIRAGGVERDVAVEDVDQSLLDAVDAGYRSKYGRRYASIDYAAVPGVAATVGLVIGGMFVGWLSWRVGFFVNAPIGVAMMLAAPRYLPETEPRLGQTDAIGALTSTFGMTALVFGIVRSADAGWGDGLTLAAVTAGVLLLAGFLARERRAASPVMRYACSRAASDRAPTPTACCSSPRWRRSGSSPRSTSRASTATAP